MPMLIDMKKMKLFLDTHDVEKGTFPKDITADDFAGFFAKYQEACREEGVVIVKIHVSLEEGRAFCLDLAPDADAVKRAHDRVGLPFDSTHRGVHRDAWGFVLRGATERLTASGPAGAQSAGMRFSKSFQMRLSWRQS